MRNKLTKFLTSECPPKGMRQFAKTWKYAACMLLAFILGIGQMWADETYYLQDPAKTNGTPALTGDFYTTAALSFSVNKAYDAVTYKNGLTFGGNLTSLGSNCKNSNYQVRYDCKTNSTEFTVLMYATNTSKTLNYYTIQENASIGSACTVSSLSTETMTNGVIATKTLTVSNSTRTSVYFAVNDKGKATICQIIAVEKGTAFPKPGEAGYSVNFNKGRYIAASGKVGTLDETPAYSGLEMHMNTDYYYSTTAGKMQTNGTNYIKFAVEKPMVLNFTTSSTSQYNVSTTKGGDANKITPTANVAKKINLTAAGTYYINPQGSNVTPTGMVFSAAPKVTYNANGGTGSMEPTYFTVADNEFEAPDGMMFKEWNSLSTGSGDAYEKDDDIENDITLYAIWETSANKYDVTFDSDGGTAVPTQEVKEGLTASEPTAPTKDCYTFAGWYNGANLFDFSSTITGDVALTAHWTPNYAFGAYSFNSLTVGTAPSKTITTGEVTYADPFRVDNFYFDGGIKIQGEIGTDDEGLALNNYKGWKLKTTGKNIKFLVENNCQVKVAVGSANTLKVLYTALDGAAQEANLAQQTETPYLVKGGTIVTLQTTTGSTITLKRITISSLYTATYTDGTGDASGSESNVVEVTLPTPSETTIGTSTFTGWTPSVGVKVGGVDKGTSDLLAAGTVVTLLANTTFTAQWLTVSDFDVKFYPGYGTNEQIGATQQVSTGDFATAPATDPTRDGFVFLGWSTDGTEANIKDVATFGITAATNFTAMWKAVWTVTFDGAGNVIVEDGETVASPDSPTQEGKIFQGWYNGESKYDFSAAVAGNLALTSKWVDADANHYIYAYNDDFHFDGVVYKTPEGKTTDPDASEATLNMTTPYTLFSGAEGITSIVATKAVYDYKKADNTKHITAYLKLKKSSDDANSKLIFTIASGYTAVLKVKMGGYSKTPTVTLKKGDDAVTGTPAAVSGKAEDKDYAEITYNLVAGVYEMTTADQTLYFSHIDLETEAIPAKTVTYKAGEGTGSDVVDAAATEVADVPSTFTAPTGKVFNGWKDETNADVEVGAIVSNDMTLTAQWIAVYAVTFNMNGHGDAIDPQDIKEGAKATKPADPSESGWDFGGWFTDNGTFEASFDFNTSITAATPLYAKWTADPCPDKKSIVKAVMTSTSTAAVTGYNDNEYAGGYIINNLADGDNAFAYDFGEGSVTGYKLKGSGSAIFATLAKGGFEAGDKVVFAVTKKAGDNKLAVYAAKDKNNVLKLAEIDVADAGIYEYKLKAADIAAIEAAGADYKSIGSYRGDYNPYIYSVELKGCRSWAVMHTLTFKNFDGTADIATESLEEGAYASTVAPTAPKITLKRFIGWSEDMNGTPVDLASYTLTTDKILYAVYEDIVCPTTGTVYKFEIKDELPSENLPTSTDKDMSSYITATGDGYLTYTATANNKATINSDGTIQMKDASAAYLKVELECALAAGDQIRAHVTNNPIRVQVGTTYDSNKDLILAKNAYEFVAITSAMEGKQVLYITRSSNGNANLADFEIYRPAKYDVSFNMMGHGSAIADLEDVVEGSKIAAPSPAPTDVDYSFAGWYKENTLENEWDFDVDVVTDNITLYAKWLDKSDATLKSLKYGETDIVLVVDQYTYDITLPSLTSSVPALTAETNNPNATKLIANGTFDGAGNATSTVTVTPEAGADKVYTVNFSRGVALEQATVTASTEWDWSAAGVTAEINNDNTPGLSGNDVVIANVPGVNNDADFNSQALKASGTNAIRTEYFQGKQLNIKTDKEGLLIVDFCGTNGNARVLKVYDNADNEIAAWNYNSNSTRQVQQVVVPAGNVTLKAFEGENGNNARIYNLKFYALAYTRDDSWMAPGELGTICYPEGLVAVGAEMYEMAGVDDNNKFVFDEVSVLDPGKPYLFVAQSNVLKFYATTATAAGAAGTNNGMVGTFASIDLSHTDARAAKWYYFSGTKFYAVSKRTSDLNVPANRAYVDLNESHPAGAPKHGVRRISFGVEGANAATGIGNAQGDEVQSTKVLINGQLFILRGEKLYDATGRMVK